jgi:hypothetical protein
MENNPKLIESNEISKQRLGFRDINQSVLKFKFMKGGIYEKID